MRVGTSYILFVAKDTHGYSVDNCGNSSDLKHAAAVVSEARKLAANAGT